MVAYTESVRHAVACSSAQKVSDAFPPEIRAAAQDISCALKNGVVSVEIKFKRKPSNIMKDKIDAALSALKKQLILDKDPAAVLGLVRAKEFVPAATTVCVSHLPPPLAAPKSCDKQGTQAERVAETLRLMGW